MIRYILKRLVLMIPTILLTSLLIFWAMSLTGGDPVQTILPENASIEQQEALRESMGLNDPFFIRNGYRAVRTAQFTVLKVKKGHSVANLRQRLNGRANHPRNFSH